MNWREKLADWISGGELSRLIHDNSNLLYGITQEADYADELAWRLETIAACETPKANATVKRMARMAREAKQ